MDAREFAYFSALVYDRTRIVLRPEKREMLHIRLHKRMRALGLDSLSDYRELLENQSDPGEVRELINAVTTNLTQFFREPHHFEHLARHALPEVVQRNGASRRLRIWSAGCSSGQEAWSIAMAALQYAPDLARWDFRVLATDIDTEMLVVAAAGRYPAEQGHHLPAYARAQCRMAENGTIEMPVAARRVTVFRHLNLIGDWPMRGQMDIVFCRNVVIYFDKPTQQILFDRFADLMPLGGWLYVGHSESLFKVCERFRPIGQTVYRKIA